MKTIFLETNAINACVDKNVGGEILKELLKRNNYTPIVSQHTLYELARTCLSCECTDKVKKLFLCLKELSPIFTCQTKNLLKREIKKLEDEDYSVHIFIETEYEKNLDDTILALSLGKKPTQDQLDFIFKMEEHYQQECIRWNTIIRKNFRLKQKTFKEFSANYFNNVSIERLKKLIENHVDITLKEFQVIKLKNDITRYPALRTLINSVLYLNFIVYKHKDIPSKDKSDDFRHLIDSSYCTVLVTNDKKFTRLAKEIESEKDIITFDQLISRCI